MRNNPKAKLDIEWYSGFAPIVILLIFVLIELVVLEITKFPVAYKSAVALFANPPEKIMLGFPQATPDTSTWETYTNATMSFSLKLPPNWFTHAETKTLYGYSVIFSYPVDNSSGQDFTEGQVASINIGLSRNNGEDVNKIAQNRTDSDKIHNPYGPSYGNSLLATKIDGENAIILSSKDGLYEEVIVVHEGKYYLISVFTQTKNDQIKETFSQILSTFRFIN